MSVDAVYDLYDPAYRRFAVTWTGSLLRRGKIGQFAASHFGAARLRYAP